MRCNARDELREAFPLEIGKSSLMQAAGLCSFILRDFNDAMREKLDELLMRIEESFFSFHVSD